MKVGVLRRVGFHRPRRVRRAGGWALHDGYLVHPGAAAAQPGLPVFFGELNRRCVT